MDSEAKARLQKAMDQGGLDGVVAFSRENVAYMAGYVVPSQAFEIRDRTFAVAMNRDGEAAMLLTSNELQEARDRSTLQELRPYDQFGDDPMAVLAGIIRDLGLSESRVGLELSGITVDRWDALRPLFPKTRWQSGDDAFKFARKIKTMREIGILRQLAKIADQAQQRAHTGIREGMTEHEVYRLIVNAGLELAAESLRVQVAAGERSSFSNPTPSARILRSGELVKIDVSVASGGYSSDTGRGFVVTAANDRQLAVWAAMQETLRDIHQAIRPGARTGAIWKLFVNKFAQHGMAPCMRFLGHGLGLAVHEEPYIAGHTDEVLEAGMVMAVEPVFQDADGTGYHLEDNLLVTEDGVENFTTLFGPKLIVVG
jgi:Xaa-Pro dipeptidase